MDRSATESLIHEVLQEEQLSYPLREATRQLGLIKNQRLWEDKTAMAPQLLQLYQAYQQKLALFQRFDFDDILIKAVELWLAAPEWLVPDVNRSDHAAYWNVRYPALMITDTANYRNYAYHNTGDVARTLDYAAMARVVSGLTGMLAAMADD